jgi:two-component sensor histidine kinase
MVANSVNLTVRDDQTVSFAKNLFSNRHYQFCVFQLIFWLGLMVVTFFSLTLWYNTAEPAHIVHTTLQAVLGAAVSFPLRNFYTWLWDKPPLSRITLTLLMVSVSSAVWTALRMVTFIWIVQEEKNLWQDFGGWYFGGFFIFFCWTALYYGVKYYHLMQLEHRKVVETEAQVHREHNKRLEAEAVAREAQLKMLRYQLNPHFLFNTLNAIYALIRMKDNKTAQTMVQQLSRFLRYSLDNDPSHRVSLEQELEALMLYLEIEQTRFGDRLKLDIQVSDDAKTACIPSLLLQPLAENAIKYAISQSEHGGTIGVKADVSDEVLHIEVWDDGPGLNVDQEQLLQGRGVGLRNTLDRLATLYGDQQQVDLRETDSGGLTIMMRFPFEPESETEELDSQIA